MRNARYSAHAQLGLICPRLCSDNTFVTLLRQSCYDTTDPKSKLCNVSRLSYDTEPVIHRCYILGAEPYDDQDETVLCTAVYEQGEQPRIVATMLLQLPEYILSETDPMLRPNNVLRRLSFETPSHFALTSTREPRELLTLTIRSVCSESLNCPAAQMRIRSTMCSESAHFRKSYRTTYDRPTFALTGDYPGGYLWCEDRI